MLGYPKIKVLARRLRRLGPAVLPVTKDVPVAGKEIILVLPKRAMILIDSKHARRGPARARIALLDVRDIDEWIGESSSLMGRISAPARDASPRRSGSNGTPHDEADGGKGRA